MSTWFYDLVLSTVTTACIQLGCDCTIWCIMRESFHSKLTLASMPIVMHSVVINWILTSCQTYRVSSEEQIHSGGGPPPPPNLLWFRFPPVPLRRQLGITRAKEITEHQIHHFASVATEHASKLEKIPLNRPPTGF